ncbi:MAG: YicC family protein [Candidatus Latescibacteria bacterium]|nr:YicC family protein [Candidatus Latescibacterota bacterium]
MTEPTPIHSMTGFGRAAAERRGLRLAVELRSVNSRYLDIQVRCPADIQPFELAIRERIQARVRRGKINAHLAWEEENQPEALPQLDEEAAKHYLAQLRRLAELAQIEAAGSRATLPLHKAFFARFKGLEHFNVGIERVLLAKLPNLFRVQAAALDSAVVQEVLRVGLDQALAELVAMREAEGHTLAADLRDRVEAVGAHLERVAERAQATRGQVAERLREKIAALLAPGTVAEDRLATEIALIAERSDIVEEIVRFRSHNTQFLATLAQGGEVGKRLNFLLQEMHREANTISAKASDARSKKRLNGCASRCKTWREGIHGIRANHHHQRLSWQRHHHGVRPAVCAAGLGLCQRRSRLSQAGPRNRRELGRVWPAGRSRWPHRPPTRRALG